MTEDFYKARNALVITTHKEDDCILCRVNWDAVRSGSDVMGHYYTTCDCPKHTSEEKEHASDVIELI